MSRSIINTLSLSNRSPLIISHRGDWQNAPENSAQAILSAAQAGADIVEIDVRQGADGTLFLMHDDRLDRTTNARGPTDGVYMRDLSSIKLRQGLGGNSAITNETVPSLIDALETARGRVYLNIDAKDPKDLNAVCDLVLRTGMENHVLVKKVVAPNRPDTDILGADWFGKIPFMPAYLTPTPGSMAKEMVILAKTYDAQILEIGFSSVDELRETRDHMRKLGVRLWLNTLDPVHSMDIFDSRAIEDPANVWGYAIRNGIGAIQTDHSAALAEYLGR